MMKLTSKKFALAAVPLALTLAMFGCGGGGGGSSSSWQDLEATTYAGTDLGASYNAIDGSASFKVWAPQAGNVSLKFYSPQNHETLVGEDIALTKDDATGVWSGTVKAEDVDNSPLKGYFYHYNIDGTLALDPYAKSMAENKGGKGKAAIVDQSEVVVDAYAELPANWKREDAIIYEMHVRDFTVDPEVENELNGKDFGTFTAFIEKLDYIKALGVTHIQLLPVMAYYYGDESQRGMREGFEGTESGGGNNYNWGYDPHSYFAPEGMYASDPADAHSRVNELKELINAIHDQGMAVTLDVVYNHQPNRTIFDAVVPGYYYRSDSNSNAGDDIASERTMASKLIVDSLAYWTREYKVDGFRFDLMGLIDRETMTKGYEASKALNPNTLFVGEGWKMYGGDKSLMADQNWATEQDITAMFSDDIRNVIKSGYPSEGQPKFITGGAQDIQYVFENIKAQPSANFTADDPGDVLQYIAAHDNLTLHDVIWVTLSNAGVMVTEAEVQKRIRLGNTIILTSQGIAFLHGGQEYGRTKTWTGSGLPEKGTQTTDGKYKFINDSYDSSDRVNHFDWSAVTTEGGLQKQTMEYTSGLIHLRRSSEAFHLGTELEVNSSVKMLESTSIAADDLVIAYSTTDGTDTYYVFVNADDVSRKIDIAEDLTAGDILVTAEQAGIIAIATDEAKAQGVEVGSSWVKLAPLTATVIKVTQ